MNSRRVELSFDPIWVQDYETFDDNEYAREYINKVVYLDNNQPNRTINIPPPKVCAGGEVWPALEIRLELRDVTGAINVEIWGELYEGTTCATNDRDATYNEWFIVYPNQRRRWEFGMESEDNSEDKTEITLFVANDPG